MARKTTFIGWSCVFFALFLTVPHAAAAAEDPYIGTGTCSTCHAEQGKALRGHGHPKILRPVVGAAAPTEFEGQPPQGMKWGEITYLVGGAKNYARFLDRQGFVVTGDDAQWSFYGKTLTPFKKEIPRGKLAYACIKCHSVGWRESGAYDEGEENALPGIPGVWFENGVGCESCHGPGRAHFAVQDKDAAKKEGRSLEILIDRRVEACGGCHNRNKDNAINLVAADLLLSRQQYAEFMRSPMGQADLTCLSCHDPHHASTGSSGFLQTCKGCHDGQEIRIKAMAHLNCIDCHMPFAARGAYDVRIKGYHRGDTRTHLFAISKDPDYAIDEGTKLAAAAKKDGGVRLTAEMTCYACHQSGAEVELPRDQLLEAMKRVHAGP